MTQLVIGLNSAAKRLRVISGNSNRLFWYGLLQNNFDGSSVILDRECGKASLASEKGLDPF